jgi:hypothetical protein
MQHNKWIQGGIVAAIIIILNLFFNYTISLVYKEPRFEDFFPPRQEIVTHTTYESCTSVGGKWTDTIGPNEKGVVVKSGFCEEDYIARQMLDRAQSTYQMRVFILLVVSGFLSIVAGIFVAHTLLKNAFVWGGVLSFVIASMRYWSLAGGMLRVIILAIALIGLIVLVLKKFGSEEGR